MEMRTPADLLACIPMLVGREPEEMMVMVTVKDNQVQGAMVMEHCPDIATAPRYMLNVMEALTELEPERLALVFYTESESDGLHEPYEDIYDLIEMAVDALTPIEAIAGVLVKGGRFHLYNSDHWHDMAEVKESAMAAALVLNGVPLVPDGVTIPEPTALTEDVTEAIDEAVTSLPPLTASSLETWADPATMQARELFESLLQRGFGATEVEAVTLIACFQRPMIRDRLMVDTISSTTDLEEFVRTISGNSETPISRPRMVAAVSLLDNLMQWTCDRHRLPLLVTQAWLYWMQGKEIDAEAYCDAALKVDPEYRMASVFRYYVHNLKRMPSSIFMEREE
jgi:hypothetical protein